MKQGPATISIASFVVLILLIGAWGSRATAEESGLWEAELRQDLLTATRQSVRDVFSQPRLRWNRGPVFETSNKALVARVGYEGQFDAASYGGMEQVVEQAAGAEWTSGVTARRSRVVLEFFFLHDTYFRARYGTGSFSGLHFQDLFLEWSGLTRLPGSWWPVIRIGQIKEPMSLDWMNSGFRTTFVERAMFTTSIVPNRNPGVRLHGRGPGDRVTYQLGAYAVNAASLSERGEGAGQSITGRITGLPWAPAKRPNHLLHVGLSTSWRLDIEHYDVGSKPESWVGPKVVKTGKFAADGAHVVAGEVFYQRDRLSFAAEAAWTHINRPDGADADYWGAYGQVSYFLTPAHIPYNRKLGTYGRIRPKCSIFCPAKSGLGEWEVAARYSILDLTDGPSPGGQVWNVTLGVNWYARDNIRVSCNYIYTDVMDAYGVTGANGTMNTLVVRFAYEL